MCKNTKKRRYKELPLAENIVKALKEQIALLNREGNLHTDGLGHRQISL